jgi:glycerate 2-kinase
MPTTYSHEHNLIRRVYGESLRSVEPRQAVRSAIEHHWKSLAVDGRTVVIAIGKAAPAMAQGALDALEDRIDTGIILTKHGHVDAPVPGFTAFEAGHPIPDENGASATREVIATVSDLAAEDIVIALVSGGGSALLELPRDPLTLEDLQDTTRLLLHAGANIHELNAVRSMLSQVKGGGLRRIIGPARCVSLLLSDVLGNDPGVIASGPTIPIIPSLGKAQEIIRRYHLEDRLPRAAMSVLSQESAPAVYADLGADDICDVIADNATLVSEADVLFQREGLTTSVAWHAFDGDATDLGHRIVDDAVAASDDIDVLIGGGEATVEVTGDGVGGRNTEAALVAAMELERMGAPWVIASLASDGQDGASEATGAIADPGTCERARAVAVDPAVALRNNDSATFFERTGGLVTTGPSGTNVNDVYIALRIRGEGRQ